MVLALLIYCDANGTFGSRRIERATYRDVAVRYLCADTHPDHRGGGGEKRRLAMGEPTPSAPSAATTSQRRPPPSPMC